MGSNWVMRKTTSRHTVIDAQASVFHRLESLPRRRGLPMKPLPVLLLAPVEPYAEDWEGRPLFTSILCASVSAPRSTSSKAQLQ
jgi:hypothetical protein